jgi:hypothetical protein
MYKTHPINSRSKQQCRWTTATCAARPSKKRNALQLSTPDATLLPHADNFVLSLRPCACSLDCVVLQQLLRLTFQGSYACTLRCCNLLLHSQLMLLLSCQRLLLC